MYKGKDGSIVYALENNLETFTGIFLSTGHTAKESGFKIGKIYPCLNADYKGWTKMRSPHKYIDSIEDVKVLKNLIQAIIKFL